MIYFVQIYLACYISPRTKGEGVYFDLWFSFFFILPFVGFSRRFEATQTGTLVLTDFFYNT